MKICKHQIVKGEGEESEKSHFRSHSDALAPGAKHYKLKGHEFQNLGSGSHEYYNHAFSLSPPGVKVEKNVF